MTLTELKYIVAVARERHFGRAAEACFVSQPTLSVAIRKLEDELGVQLFERGGGEIGITPVGEQIVEQAQRVLEQTNAIREIAVQGKDPLVGPLRVGVIYTIGPYLLPRLVPRMIEDAPQMPLLLQENFTVKLLELLRQGDIDIAILADPFPDHGLVTLGVYDEPFVVAVPRQHPWARRKSIRSTELKEQTMLLLAPPLPRPGARSLPGAVTLFAGERRDPEDLRGIVVGDDPAHGRVGDRRHRPPWTTCAAARTTCCATFFEAPRRRTVSLVWHRFTRAPAIGQCAARSGLPGVTTASTSVFTKPQGASVATQRVEHERNAPYPTIDRRSAARHWWPQRIWGRLRAARHVLGKLEGSNRRGVGDRPALAMIARRARGEIRPGDTLIEATSGNTGIGLAWRRPRLPDDPDHADNRYSRSAVDDTAPNSSWSRAQGMEGARLADRSARGPRRCSTSSRTTTTGRRTTDHRL